MTRAANGYPGGDSLIDPCYQLYCQLVLKVTQSSPETVALREDINKKKRFLSGIARMRGGGLPMPEGFGPFSRGAFLVNKKSLFL